MAAFFFARVIEMRRLTNGSVIGSQKDLRLLTLVSTFSRFQKPFRIICNSFEAS